MISEETRKKLSDSHKKNPTKYWLGKKRSKETIEKIREKKIGTKHSEETKKKMSGRRPWNWKGGLMSDPVYASWMKNKRNRVLKKIKSSDGGHTFGEWETLKAQYNWTCPCCGRPEPVIKLTEDHIIPLSKGGSDNIENIQPLCGSCNCKKYNKSIKY